MELDLKEVLKKISIDIRKAMIKVFNGEDDVEGECEQASIILWKYINDTGLVSSDKNKVALGTFNNHGHNYIFIKCDFNVPFVVFCFFAEITDTIYFYALNVCVYIVNVFTV